MDVTGYPGFYYQKKEIPYEVMSLVRDKQKKVARLVAALFYLHPFYYI